MLQQALKHKDKSQEVPCDRNVDISDHGLGFVLECFVRVKFLDHVVKVNTTTFLAFGENVQIFFKGAERFHNPTNNVRKSQLFRNAVTLHIFCHFLFSCLNDTKAWFVYLLLLFCLR